MADDDDDDQVLAVNAMDIASANMAFSLMQSLLGLLVKKKILERDEVRGLWKELADTHGRATHPQRRNINRAIAEAAGAIAKLYDVPAKGKQH